MFSLSHVLCIKFSGNIFFKVQQRPLQLPNVGCLARVLPDSEQESLPTLLHCLEVQQASRDEDREEVAEFTPGLLEVWGGGEEGEVARTEDVREVGWPETGPETGQTEEDGVRETVGLREEESEDPVQSDGLQGSPGQQGQVRPLLQTQLHSPHYGPHIITAQTLAPPGQQPGLHLRLEEDQDL